MMIRYRREKSYWGAFGRWYQAPVFVLLLLAVGYSATAQLACISRSISSNPNIGTVAAPNYLVGIDANNCPVTRPTSNYISVSLCNTCPNPVNVGTITYTGSKLPGVGLVATQVPTQDVGILAPGECKAIYYHLKWPCNPMNNDVPFTLSFQLNDGAATSNMS
jgi:hypothetical protein